MKECGAYLQYKKNQGKGKKRMERCPKVWRRDKLVALLDYILGGCMTEFEFK